MTQSRFTQLDAVTIYARTWNNLDDSILEPFLSNDVCYESQHVFSPLNGKKEVLDYLSNKMHIIKQSPTAQIRAEIGTTQNYSMFFGGGEPCVLLYQGNSVEPIVLVLFKVANNLIQRIDICSIPIPSTARKSGVFPQ